MMGMCGQNVRQKGTGKVRFWGIFFSLYPSSLYKDNNGMVRQYYDYFKFVSYIYEFHNKERVVVLNTSKGNYLNQN